MTTGTGAYDSRVINSYNVIPAGIGVAITAGIAAQDMIQGFAAGSRRTTAAVAGTALRRCTLENTP